jgi:2-haloacid dehalogenase
MRSNRREFFGRVAAAGMLTASHAAGSKRPIKAIAFDAFPILDPRPVFALVEELFPGKGADLAAAWRTRQFEYAWLRTMSKSYADFWQVTEDALVFAAKMLKLDLPSDKRVRLMDAYLAIRCWPDAPDALRSLKNSGIHLAFLSNLTRKMLEAGIRNSGLEGVFEHVLSTDLVKVYKPDPRAYQMGVDTFGLKHDEIVFAAFAGWDAAGAKAFGYPTFWVNRQNQPAEELGVTPDAAGVNLNDLVRYVAA